MLTAGAAGHLVASPLADASLQLRDEAPKKRAAACRSRRFCEDLQTLSVMTSGGMEHATANPHAPTQLRPGRRAIAAQRLGRGCGL
jgi:hypothetical protein